MCLFRRFIWINLVVEFFFCSAQQIFEGTSNKQPKLGLCETSSGITVVTCHTYHVKVHVAAAAAAGGARDCCNADPTG